MPLYPVQRHLNYIQSTTFKMNLWPKRYRGMQIVNTTDEDDKKHLPQYSNQKSKKSIWLLLPLVCTLILIASLVSFHLRLHRSISKAPIVLPLRRYVFTDHPELRPFDQETTEKWRPFGIEHWWSMPWTDSSGNRVVQGIDMLHKLHCLMAIRREFTMLATDENRRDAFNARTAEAITGTMHLKHCFDFIRQDIMCQADATVEPLGPGYSRSDGLGVEHECRDWDVVMKYADTNHFFPEQLKDLKRNPGAFFRRS